MQGAFPSAAEQWEKPGVPTAFDPVFCCDRLYRSTGSGEANQDASLIPVPVDLDQGARIFSSGEIWRESGLRCREMGEWRLLEGFAARTTFAISAQPESSLGLCGLHPCCWPVFVKAWLVKSFVLGEE